MRARRRRGSSCSRPLCSSSSRRSSARTRLARDRDLLPLRAHLGRDRRRDLRLRRQLGRPLVRPDQLRRGRRVRGGRDDGPARVEAGRPARPLPAPARPHGRQRPVARCSPRSSAASFALARRAAADAAVRASRRASRRSPCSRSRTTCCASGRRSAPGATTLSLVPETTDLPAGGDRRGDRDRGRLRLPAQPFRAALRATREDPPAAQAVGHRRPPPAALGVHALGRARRASRAASTSTCSARSRPTQVYLELTFLTLAMLVVGGIDEPLGRGGRGARGERARLVPQRGGAAASASAVTSTCRRARGSSILGALMALVLDPPPVGIDRRARVRRSRACAEARRVARLPEEGAA